MDEYWKDLQGYEDRYAISNLGNIKNLKTNVILSPWLNTNGYKSITLRKDGNPKSLKVHQLVAVNFLNHNPNGMNLVVDHINKDKLDNRVDNLRLVTQKENSLNTKKITLSKYRGVSFDKRVNKWFAYVTINNKFKWIKSSKCELSCAVAYNLKLKEI